MSGRVPPFTGPEALALIRSMTWVAEAICRRRPAGAPPPLVPEPAAPEPDRSTRRQKSRKTQGKKSRKSKKSRKHEKLRKHGRKRRKAQKHPARAKVLCLALTSAKGEHQKQKLRVLRWLERWIANPPKPRKKSAIPTKKSKSSAKNSVAEIDHMEVEPAEEGMSKEDLLRHQAAAPTRKRLLELADRVPPTIGVMLKSIARLFFRSNCTVCLICREAKASSWDLKRFGDELGTTPGALIQECQREMSSLLLRDRSLELDQVANLVGFETGSALWRIYRDLSGSPPAKMRDYLLLVAPERRALGDELRGWYFWVRHHRGELKADDYQGMLAYLKECHGPR